MKKEYFIGDRHKCGLTLMETLCLEEQISSREIYKVKWTSLTKYDGLKIQIFPMVRTDGEFYDFTPVTKAEYNGIIATLQAVSEELKPLLDVKRKIDQRISETHNTVWGKLEMAKTK